MSDKLFLIECMADGSKEKKNKIKLDFCKGNLHIYNIFMTKLKGSGYLLDFLQFENLVLPNQIILFHNFFKSMNSYNLEAFLSEHFDHTALTKKMLSSKRCKQFCLRRRYDKLCNLVGHH